MHKKSIDQLVFDSIKDPKCINDEPYFLSYVWASEDHEVGTDDFNKRQQNLYRYILKHSSPESLFRIRRKLLEKNVVIKSSAQVPKQERDLFKKTDQVNPEYWEDEKPSNPEQVKMFISELKEKLK